MRHEPSIVRGACEAVTGSRAGRSPMHSESNFSNVGVRVLLFTERGNTKVCFIRAVMYCPVNGYRRSSRVIIVCFRCRSSMRSVMASKIGPGLQAQEPPPQEAKPGVTGQLRPSCAPELMQTPRAQPGTPRGEGRELGDPGDAEDRRALRPLGSLDAGAAQLDEQLVVPEGRPGRGLRPIPRRLERLLRRPRHAGNSC